MTEIGKNGSGYGAYESYCVDHGDVPDAATFDRYNRIASCMVDFLCGRGVDAENYYVREAVHWQIWFMRQRGSIQACFSGEPIRETFGGYTVERRDDDGKLRLFGMEVSPIMMQLLRCGGLLSMWV